jgi:hypothetical protein
MSSLDDVLNLAENVARMGDDLHVVVEAVVARAAIDVEPRDPFGPSAIFFSCSASWTYVPRAGCRLHGRLAGG